MSIKDDIQYKNIYHDYDMFQNCFGTTNIMPTDIDGVVERHGNFLIMEFKPEGKPLSKGQHILYYQLSLLNKFTVIILYHETREDFHDSIKVTGMEQYPICRHDRYDTYGNYISNKLKKVNNEDVINFVTNWFNNVEDEFKKHLKQLR